MTREIGPELVARIRHVADSLEAISRGEVDSPQPFEHTPQTHATQGEGSVQSDGTSGEKRVVCDTNDMADIVYEAAENLRAVRETFDQWSRATASVLYRAARHIEILEDAP